MYFLFAWLEPGQNPIIFCYRIINGWLTTINLLRNNINSIYFDSPCGSKLITMKWDIIKTNAQYIEVLKRVILIMDAKSGTTESVEREELLVLLTKYEKKHMILPEPDLMH